MKKKWQSLFSYLEKTTCETTPEGVFMKEGEIDKIAALHVEHQQLTSDLETAKADNQTAIDSAVTTATKPLSDSITAKDAEIVTLTTNETTLKTDLKTAQDALVSSEKKLAKATGTSTKPAAKGDPDPSGKKTKLTGNMKSAQNNAAALFPDVFGKPAEEDEEEEDED